MKKQTETVIVAKCIGCGKKRDISAFEVEPDSMPVCDECFMPMIAEKAVQKPVKQ